MDCSFESRINGLFNNEKLLETYCDLPDEHCSEEENCLFLIELFGNAKRYLSDFSEDQIGKGLTYVVDGAHSSYLRIKDKKKIRPELATQCIRTIETLFLEIINYKAQPVLCYKGQGNGRLSYVCYMWWDICPVVATPATKNFQEFDEACLSVMENILVKATNRACQEGALHGLNHWQHAYPQKVSAAIDRYLRLNTVDEDLRLYAQWAKQGRVQ